MNYIVISPYYPQNFQQFTVELANKGITVLGIGQEPYDQLDQPLKDSLTEYMGLSIGLSLITNIGWNWTLSCVSNLMFLEQNQKI